MNDKTAPTVTEVESSTKGDKATSVKVKFSEPVVAATFLLNGSARSGVIAADGLSATINGVSLDANSSNTLVISDLIDTNSNVSDTITKTFTVVKDVAAPKVTVTSESDNRIVLTFDKEMDVATVNGTNIKVVDESFGSITAPITTYPNDLTKTKFVATVAAGQDLYLNSDSRTLSVQISKDVKDSLGNESVATTKSVVLTKNTAAPTITGLSTKRDANGDVTDLVVNFSNKMVGPISSAALGNIKVSNSNGVDVTSGFLTTTSKALTSGGKSVEIPVVGAPKSGNFTFNIPAAFATEDSLSGKKTAAYTATIKLDDATTTPFSIASVDDTTTENTLTVDFGDKVKGGVGTDSATNPANYTLDGLPLPAGTTLAFNSASQDEVDIILGEGIAKNNTSAKFVVRNVKNDQGATVKVENTNVIVHDNVDPVLTDAEFIAYDTIRLTYDEAVVEKGTLADAAFDFKVGTKKLVSGTDFTGLTVAAVGGYANKVDIQLGAIADPVYSAIKAGTGNGSAATTAASINTTGDYKLNKPTSFLVKATAVSGAVNDVPTQIQYSTDGGTTWSADQAVTSGTAVALENGVEFTLTDSSTGEIAKLGDTWSFDATPTLNSDKIITITTNASANNTFEDVSTLTVPNTQKENVTVRVK